MSSKERREFLDWTLPSARSRLRAGDVLETYDCGYITVKAITAEGVIQANTAPGFPDHFWTWDKLKHYQCCIIYEDTES